MVKRTKPKVLNGLSCAHSRKFRVFLFFLIVAILPSVTLTGQQKKQKTISIDFKDYTVIHALHEINVRSGDMVVFREEIVTKEKKRVTLKRDNISVLEAVKACLVGTNLTCEQQPNGKILVAEKPVKKVNLVTVSGRVVDEKGFPIPGASVVVYGTTQGVATDVEGRYTLSMLPDGVLQISFIGYKTETIPINGKKTVNITLNPTSENIEEVQVVAFGTQKKESVVSAITTIRPMDLKSSSSDLTTQLTGKIAGIIGWQTGGIPEALTEEEMNTKFYIRGISSSNGVSEPLVLIDGVESSRLDLARMAPEDIESFSVLKDASATAMYGARGANGVILVTTKKGEEGSVYTSIRYESVISMPTDKIEVVDPKTYMRMYNQALLARNPKATPVYSIERIERTGNPNYPSYVYPANNWYDILFKDYSVNHRFGVNVRGGSNILQYYASVNYNRDAGMLKTDNLNQFDVNIKNSTIASRINLNVNLNAGIRLLLNTSFSIDKYHGPASADVTTAYAMAFNASPVDFAPTYPGDKQYGWPHIRFGNVVGGATSGIVNPYAEIQLGYSERGRYSVTTRAEYIHNLSSLLKGLELRASVSLVKTGYDQVRYITQPFYYYLNPETGYDFETGEHTLTLVRSGRRTLEKDASGDVWSTTTQWTYEGQLLHTAAWDDHQTSLVAVLQAQQASGAPVASLFEGIEHRNLSFSMRGSYGYKDRYFMEASFGYNGSERFAQQNRMGFFPAIGGAWIVSKENFMQGINKWIHFFKLRASWGKVGNDGIIESPRFVYMPQIDKSQNVFIGPNPEPGNNNTFHRYQIQNYGDPGVEWEIAEQINFGVETQFFKGILEINADIYKEIRHNIIDKRVVIPANIGVEIPPLDNIGKVCSRGVDLSAKIQHAFTPDVWFILNGTFTYNKAVYKELEEATNKPEWQQKVGHEISQQVGYIAEGLFRDQAEIDNAPSQPTAMPGDIRYRDVNGDGIIDTEDAVHIGFPETPRMIYGISGYFNYKNWEFNFAFQGSGNRGFFLNPVALSPFVNSHAMLKEIYESHWTEDNMSNHPFWPRLSTQGIEVYNPQEDWYNEDATEIRKSTYFMRECRFLRCTALELAYNLPTDIKSKLRMQNIKFFVRANNPFLISNFKIWDVELGENGFNYPIQKTYAIGLNISF
ncbi:MAG: TonB-dependent receptor [Marinifilaceae bacterium]|nr:TonB-dependent receptor [Marinifilaceae bacterium]